MRIVCFGDSITLGQYLPPEQAWPALLAEMTGHEVINAGVANETTRQALERFPRHVQELRPEVVFIQFGLNDCNRWKQDGGLPRVSLHAYLANLVEMCERADAFGIRPILCELTPTRKSAQHAADKDIYNQALIDEAREYGADVLLQNTFRQGLGFDHLLDAVHLAPEGHRLFAEGASRCLQAPVFSSAAISTTTSHLVIHSSNTSVGLIP